MTITDDGLDTSWVTSGIQAKMRNAVGCHLHGGRNAHTVTVKEVVGDGTVWVAREGLPIFVRVRARSLMTIEAWHSRYPSMKTS